MKTYEIISWNKAFESVYDANFTLSTPTKIVTSDEAKILVFELQDNKTIVMPEYPVSGFSKNDYPAFVYTDKNVLSRHLAELKFPVPARFVTILDNEKENILGIEKKYSDYIAFFDLKMGTDFSSRIEYKDLQSVHSLIIQKLKEADFDKLLFSYSIVVSRYLIESKKMDGFELIKRNQGYSSYIIPCVKSGESLLSVFECINIETLKQDFKRFFTNMLLSSRPQISEIKSMSFEELLKYLGR